ncbi:antibiotic ABC transporter permease [Halapricum desulfuricans]|uniref:Prenyltransferase family protein containing thioredoxin domain n=1 Tax=Halapricum desulfuricans TaxID=2841257 RepID=A0A897MYQ4_9EURY|nr:antibiotic ABC transporter permease [Halapricum desulfuricans]QSG05411.1 Prenyltransferase family protein containing thioredoxin domain [Halapricum desulfuricans]
MDGTQLTPTKETHAVSTDVVALCRDVLEYSRERDYTGWDYVDGLSSEFVQWLPFENKYLNLAVQEGIKRAPVNLRPYFRVEQRRSYLGAALFAMANVDMYRLTGDDRYAREATDLVSWLVSERVEGFSGYAGGGHRHPIQSLGRDTASTPGESSGVVSATLGAEAFLQYDEAFDAPEYAELAHSAAEFVIEDLDYTAVDEGAHINYIPRDTDAYTLNANALGARLLVNLYARFDEDRLLDAAREIMDYVASKQAINGGWMYTDPPSASHLSMDSFHNGFIIESLLRYREVTGSDRYDPTIRRAREFYREQLFEPDGAPNWDESSTYPRDIHAAAQGIIVFTELGEFAFARRIIDWARDTLYAGDGQFYYQQRRFYTKRFTLMRWCQAWMAYALSTYATANELSR